MAVTVICFNRKKKTMKLSRALSDLVYMKSVGTPDFEAQGEKNRKYMWKSHTSCEIQNYEVDEKCILGPIYLGSKSAASWRATMKSSQVTFIYIPLYTIQIVSKQLYSVKQKNSLSITREDNTKESFFR